MKVRSILIQVREIREALESSYPTVFNYYHRTNPDTWNTMIYMVPTYYIDEKDLTALKLKYGNDVSWTPEVSI